MSQQERVLQYMRDFGSITPLDAIKDLEIMRLAAVIHTLRHKKGYPIESKIESATNRYNEPTFYARYSMGGSK